MYEVDQYTVSLLHFEDGLKDETGKVWTGQNGVAVNDTQSKFGGKSLYLNGTNQSLTTLNSSDFDFGTGDFTIDSWINYTGSNNNQAICGKWCQVYGQGDYLFSILSNKLVFAFGTYSETVSLLIGNTIISPNTWHHVAIVRSNNEFTIFLNGKTEAKATFSGSAFDTKFPLSVGAYGNPSGNFNVGLFNGYINELRVSKGIARWTADFTPPTVPSPLSAPLNLMATAGDSQITLSWTSVTGATGYNVKRSTTAGGPYTIVGANVPGTSYVDTVVTNGTTYYYVVTAVNADGESANSNEASATPNKSTPLPTENALLRVTMLDSSEREFQLSINEIEGFINWVKGHVSTDPNCYMLNKIEVLQNSKEYLMFDKIISFEVMEITK